MPKPLYTAKGFTLIELLVAMAIVALLLSIATPRYFHSVTKAEENVLKENLALVRDTLDKYHADTGKYPETLDELLSKKYLRKMPYDPVAQSTTSWILIAPAPPEKGGIFDIRSGALGHASDGSAYGDW